MSDYRPPELRRVVVTGIGLVTPLGIGRDDTWDGVVSGRSGAGPITHYDATGQSVQIACEISDFEPTDFMDKRSVKRMERFSQIAVAAGRLAVEDAGLTLGGKSPRTGAIIGCGVGGLEIFTKQVLIAEERGPDRLSPLFIPLMVANMASANLSMQLGLQGPLTCVTSACASGNHAIGDAVDQIRLGRADVMLGGGVESGTTEVGVGSFAALRALSTRNDEPEAASRPFDVDRDGFVFGEGSGIFVLEALDHALERGVEPICEVLGYGLTGDAHHLTDNDPTGVAPAAAMTMALDATGRSPEEVDYINAHATSTPTGDPNEVRAIKLALGETVAAACPVSSTKSMHGHCLGGAGGVESGITALVIVNDLIPPTINVDNLDPACTGIDHVLGTARPARVDLALSNAFGFGGHNAVVALGRYEES